MEHYGSYNKMRTYMLKKNSMKEGQRLFQNTFVTNSQKEILGIPLKTFKTGCALCQKISSIFASNKDQYH